MPKPDQSRHCVWCPMLFDTHAHVLHADLGLYPYGPLRGGARPPVSAMVFPAEELIAQMDQCGVARACVVQRATLYGYDNSYALDAALAFPARLAPVVVLDAEDPASPQTLRDLAARQALAGLRIVAPTLTRDETGWLAGPEARRLWATAAGLGLPVAVIVYRLNHAAGLAALAEIAREFSDVPIILDHAGMPHPSTPELRWAMSQGLDYALPAGADFGVGEHLSAFDDLLHVHFKLTDINCDRLADAGLDAAQFVRVLADRFGAGRLVWGSDVGQSPAPYDHKIKRLHQACALLDAAERAALTGGTAQTIYGRIYGGQG